MVRRRVSPADGEPEGNGAVGAEPVGPSREEARLRPVDGGAAPAGGAAAGYDAEQGYLLSELEEAPGTTPRLYHDPKYPAKAWRKVPNTKNRYQSAYPGDAPRVLAVIEDEGGEEGQAVYYEIGLGGRVVLCSHDELARGVVWERFAGVAVLGSSGSRNASTLANYVLYLAHSAPKYTGHRSTGWQHFRDGSGREWFGYVLPDGRALSAGEGPPGAARMVGMLEGLRKSYAGVPVPSEAEDGAISDALDFVQGVTPERGQALLLLGVSARSLAYGIERAGFTAVVEGERGTGKSSIAGLAQTLVKPYAYPPRPEMSFSDTENRLEATIARYGSFPALIDDLAIPPGAPPKAINDAERKLDRVIRPLFNDAPMRGRMRPDMNERRAFKAETVPIITAESLPPVLQSLMRRSLLVRIGEDEARIPLLRESAEHAPALMALGHRVILMLSGLVEGEGPEAAAGRLRELREYFAHQLRESLEKALGRPLPQMCESLPGTGAEVLVGLRLLERAAELSKGELTGPGARYLVGALTTQVERIEGRDEEEGEGPFMRLMGKLAEHVRRGLPLPNSGGRAIRIARRQSSAQEPETAPRVRPAGASGNVPPHVWGFEEDEEESYRKPVTVAFVEEAAGLLYLTETVRDALLAWASKTAGCEHLASARALGTAAEREGWIKRRESEKQRTVKESHRGKRERVWAVCVWHFLEDEPPGRPPPTPGAVPSPPAPGNPPAAPFQDAPTGPTGPVGASGGLGGLPLESLSGALSGDPGSPGRPSIECSPDTDETTAETSAEVGRPESANSTRKTNTDVENGEVRKKEDLRKRVAEEVACRPDVAELMEDWKGRYLRGDRTRRISTNLAHALYGTATRHEEVKPFVESYLEGKDEQR